MEILEGVGIIILIIVIVIIFAILGLVFKGCEFIFDVASEGCREGCGCIIFVLLILCALTCL